MMLLSFLAVLRALAQWCRPRPKPPRALDPCLPTVSALTCLGDCQVSYDHAFNDAVLIVAPDGEAFVHLERDHLRAIEQAVVTDCPGAWMVLVSPEGLRLSTLPQREMKPQ